MLTELVRQAGRNLRAHAGRSAVTLLGIIWGTALVILLVSWGTGLREALLAEVAAGGRRMMLFFGGTSSTGVGANRGGRKIRLRRGDPALIAEAVAGVEHVTCGGIRWGGAYVRHGNGGARSTTTFGVEPAAGALMELVAERGRFFTAADLAQHRRVAVLGAELKRQLFGDREALGERIDLNGIGYEVVGVLARKGDQIASVGPADDRKLFLPLSTFQALLSGDDTVDFVGLAPVVAADHKAVEAKVRRVLGIRHGFAPTDREALHVFDVLNFIDLFSNLLSAVRMFVIALGIVTLGIGGVGVTNILLLCVIERSPEIGLRMAVGATRRNILVQFLVEALLMTGIGGAIGIAVGVALCHAAGTQGPVHVASFLSPAAAVISAGTLVCVGVAAGLWPALRAARIDPVVALRFQ
jgi:putative ABC transport system permease protein